MNSSWLRQVTIPREKNSCSWYFYAPHKTYWCSNGKGMYQKCDERAKLSLLNFLVADTVVVAWEP